jgi:chaperonin GroEL
MLEDIAILTGGKVITEGVATKLENILMSDLGRARRVTVDRENTLILDGRGSRHEIEVRVEEIRRRIERAAGDPERENLQERLAKLAGGVALIKLGALTESEMKQKKSRVENAICSVRAVMEEGFVPGGGVALARCVLALDKLKLVGDEQIGVNVVKRAITEPLRQIAENAGEEGALVLGKISDSKDPNFGFNALTNEYEDLVKVGVVDPTKVVRSALQNATSIAVLMLTTEALVLEIPEERKEPLTGLGDMGGM